MMAPHRSQQWYAGTDLRNTYLHRAWMRRGLPDHAFDGRPHITIANTASDLTPCNLHLDNVAASVRQGAVGGLLALVRDADMIILDVPGRRLDLDVPVEELQRRQPAQALQAGYATPRRGWQRLYVDHVLQADQGADLDFLVGSSGDEVTRDSH